MKFALIDTTTGAVRQWQDHALFGYAEADPGELHALPDDFEFPEGAHWLRDGVLTSTPPAEPVEPFDSLRERTLAVARAERGPVLSILDGLQASALANDDRAEAKAIEEVKRRLRALPDAVKLAEGMDAAAMRQTVLEYYGELVAAAGPAIATAFRSLV